MIQFNIAINGQKAVDAARSFIGNACCKGIYNHGKRIAQVEIVIDDDGSYNGIPNKWVDVTVLEQKHIETVLKQLARLGFNNCPCIIQVENVSGCYAGSKDLCCFII